jgi:hypothetical protein
MVNQAMLRPLKNYKYGFEVARTYAQAKREHEVAAAINIKQNQIID